MYKERKEDGRNFSESTGGKSYSRCSACSNSCVMENGETISDYPDLTVLVTIQARHKCNRSFADAKMVGRSVTIRD